MRRGCLVKLEEVGGAVVGMSGDVVDLLEWGSM